MMLANNLLLLILASIWTVCCAASEHCPLVAITDIPQVAPDIVRVATCNIFMTGGRQNVANLVEAFDPSIFFLHGVLFEDVNRLEEDLKNLGFAHCQSSIQTYGTTSIVFASKFPLKLLSKGKLSRLENVLAVQIEINGRKIDLIGLRLGYSFYGNWQIQLENIFKFIEKKVRQMDYIIIGDFDTLFYAELIHAISKNGMVKGPFHTIRESLPNTPLIFWTDNIFVSNSIEPDILGSYCFALAGFEHFALMIDVNILGAGNAMHNSIQNNTTVRSSGKRCIIS